MKNIIAFTSFLFIFFGEVSAAPRTPFHSAARPRFERYETSLKKYYSKIPSSRRARLNESVLETANDLSVPFREIYALNITTWTQRELIQRFNYLRDTKFIEDPEVQNTLRRSSWLYPNDGCFARAHMGTQLMKFLKVSLPLKIFIFGNLLVKTDNAPEGSVSWWYHVAPVVRVDGEIYVLDPAIEPRFPVKLRQWIAAQTPDIDSVKIAICSPYAYGPMDKCAEKTDVNYSMSITDQETYLYWERSQLQAMGRNPDKELGVKPPWIFP